MSTEQRVTIETETVYGNTITCDRGEHPIHPGEIAWIIEDWNGYVGAVCLNVTCPSLRPSDRFTRAQLSAIADTIQALDFDHPFRLDAETGAVTDAYGPIELDAPSVYRDPDGDVTIDGHGTWHAMTGLTGQYGYHGAVLHASEVMSGSWGVVTAMLDEQDGHPDTVWAQVTVEVNGCGDDECSGVDCPGGAEPAGWAIVYTHPA